MLALKKGASRHSVETTEPSHMRRLGITKGNTMANNIRDRIAGRLRNLMSDPLEPGNREALEVRLAALQELLERSAGENHFEVYWLRHRIAATEESLG